MSEENVEVVQAAYAAWNAGDMAALRGLFDPEVITRAAEKWPEPGPFVGREAVMRESEWLRATWDRDTLEPITDFVAVAEFVVVRAVWHGVGHGPDSGLEHSQVYTLRNGKIIGVEFFWDHAEALDAAGLREQAMEENVEIVRRNLDAFNRRDIDAYVSTIAPDFVLHSQFAGVEGGAYHGHADIPGYFEDLAEAWHTYRAEPWGLAEGEDGRVACQLITRAQAERSGIEVTKRIGAVFSLQAGKIVRIDVYPTRAEALEAVGLRE